MAKNVRVRTTRQRRRAALVGALVAAFVALLAGPAQAATTTGSVTMLGDPGEYIGRGLPRIFHEGNAHLALNGTGEEFSVDVDGGILDDEFHLTFAAPKGHKLQRGVYVNAQEAAFRTAFRPGMAIWGDGRGCSAISGNFEVKDIGYRPDGSVSRVWVVYAQHCEGGPRALFGEVRVGFPPEAGTLAPAPSILRWPATEPGGLGTAVPVTVRATTRTKVRTVSLIGADAEAFTVRADECTGRELAGGQACQVWLRFSPTEAGTRQATLRVEPSAGEHRDVSLDGFSRGGRTRVELASDPGDYIGGGVARSYTNANAVITASGTPEHVQVGVEGADGANWSADFDPADGDIISPGRYSSAIRYPFNDPAPGFDFGGDGRGCNTLSAEFTVTSAEFGEDNRLEAFAATFEQHCSNLQPALRGLVEYRAGDTTPPPPWLTEPQPAGGGPGPGEPGPGGVSSVTMFSDPDDFIGAGTPRQYDRSNARITTSGTEGEVAIEAEGGHFGDRFSLTFAAPTGRKLRPGLYLRAQRADLREPGRPGIEIWGDARRCATVSGSFEIKDIAFTPAGAVDRLWLVYTQHCEGGPPALFGEVRVGVPPGGPALEPTPSIVRWPPAELGRAGASVPVTVRASRSTVVSGVAVGGPDADGFYVRLDECSGRALSAGASCRVWVRFAADQPGTQQAVLSVRTAAGDDHTVELDGFSRGGRTRFVMAGDDYIGGGQTRIYTNANAVILGEGSRSRAGFDIKGADGAWWDWHFGAPRGDILAPGRYAPASRPIGSGPGAQLEVYGDGRGCNDITGEFTVTLATFEEDGSLRSFAAEFEQHCERSTAALRGLVEFRVGDRTSPPPWLGGPENSEPSPPPEPSPDPGVPPEPDSPETGEEQPAGGVTPPPLDPPAQPGVELTPVAPGVSGASGLPPPAPNADPIWPPVSEEGAAAPAASAGLPRPGGSDAEGATKPGARFRRAVLARDGSALVTLACPATANSRCRGSILLKRTSGGATIGRSAFNVNQGATRRHRVRLAPAARRLLARRGSLRVVVQVRERAETRTHRATIRSR